MSVVTFDFRMQSNVLMCLRLWQGHVSRLISRSNVFFRICVAYHNFICWINSLHVQMAIVCFPWSMSIVVNFLANSSSIQLPSFSWCPGTQISVILLRDLRYLFFFCKVSKKMFGNLLLPIISWKMKTVATIKSCLIQLPSA